MYIHLLEHRVRPFTGILERPHSSGARNVVVYNLSFDHQNHALRQKLSETFSQILTQAGVLRSRRASISEFENDPSLRRILRGYFMDSFASLGSRTASPDDMGRIDLLSEHTQAFMSTAYALSRPDFDLKSDPFRLGSLYSDKTQEPRAERNIADFREAVEILDFNDRMLLSFLHDIGKVIQVVNHPKLGYDFLKRTELLRDFDPEKSVIFEQLIKHHTIFGNSYFGDGSLNHLYDLLSDPDLRHVLRNSFKREILTKYLAAALLYITVADVAGSGRSPGFLTNINMEYYLRIHEMFENILAATSLDDKLDPPVIYRETAKLNSLRIPYSLSIIDVKGRDQREGGIKFYEQLFQRRLNDFIESGEIDRLEWERAVQNMNFVEEIRYTGLPWILSDDFTENPQSSDISAEGIKFFILLDKIGRELLGERYPSNLEITFKDRHGKYARNGGRDSMACALALRQALRACTTSIARDPDGQSGLAIIEKGGIRSNDVLLSYSIEQEGSNCRLFLEFQLNDFSFE